MPRNCYTVTRCGDTGVKTSPNGQKRPNHPKNVGIRGSKFNPASPAPLHSRGSVSTENDTDAVPLPAGTRRSGPSVLPSVCPTTIQPEIDHA